MRCVGRPIVLYRAQREVMMDAAGAPHVLRERPASPKTAVAPGATVPAPTSAPVEVTASAVKCSVASEALNNPSVAGLAR